MAPNASIIGEVKLGQNSSIWYGTIVRGDVSIVDIGDDSVVQDLVTIKRAFGDKPIVIGRNVVIGPNCFIGGCTIEDFAYVGMGSSIGDNAVISSYAVLAAGAVVEKDAKVPSGQVWAGSPAKYLRDVTPDEREAIREHHVELKNLAAVHSEENEKTFQMVFRDNYLKERSYYMSWNDTLQEKLETLGFMDHGIDQPEIEKVRGSEYANMHLRQTSELYSATSWRPFKEDAAVFPEDWKIYGEDMESYDRAKKIFDQPPKPRDDSPISTLPTDKSPWTRRY